MEKFKFTVSSKQKEGIADGTPDTEGPMLTEGSDDGITEGDDDRLGETDGVLDGPTLGEALGKSDGLELGAEAVSYTHLTLPTIYSV